MGTPIYKLLDIYFHLIIISFVLIFVPITLIIRLAFYIFLIKRYYIYFGRWWWEYYTLPKKNKKFALPGQRANFLYNLIIFHRHSYIKCHISHFLSKFLK